jgi:hypothetical protein
MRNIRSVCMVARNGYVTSTLWHWSGRARVLAVSRRRQLPRWKAVGWSSAASSVLASARFLSIAACQAAEPFDGPQRGGRQRAGTAAHGGVPGSGRQQPYSHPPIRHVGERGDASAHDVVRYAPRGIVRRVGQRQALRPGIGPEPGQHLGHLVGRSPDDPCGSAVRPRVDLHLSAPRAPRRFLRQRWCARHLSRVCRAPVDGRLVAY